jgi:hypothetical protein
LLGRVDEGCGHLHWVAYGVPRSVRECSLERSRLGPVPGVCERSWTHLDLVVEV